MAGTIARAGFKRHVAASAHTVDVVYPAARVPAAGATPTQTAPTAPLTGPTTAPTVTPSASTPVKAPVTGLHCLWYDQTQELTAQAAGSESRRFPVSGWREGTVAVAAFWLDDVLLVTGQSNGPTVFRDCDAVVHLGRRYHVLGFDVGGSGSLLPYVGYLWLGSADTP